MPDIMPQGNRLNQVEIEVQGAADGARNAGYQLHMQAAARHVIVADERKHLRLVGIAVEIWTVHNFIYIMQESWSPDAARITRRMTLVFGQKTLGLVPCCRSLSIRRAISSDNDSKRGIQSPLFIALLFHPVR